MSLVDKIDEGLTNLAEVAVRKYNWVTGGNKLDLANNISRMSLFTLPTGSMLACENFPFIGGIVSLGWIGLFSLRIKTNTMNYEREMSARESGCLDPLVEIRYSRGKMGGMINGATGLASNKIGLGLLTSNSEYVGGTGLLILGSSLMLDPVQAYVMSTSEEPPHKDNCLKRGWEKTKEVVRKYLTPEPALIPALAKGRRLSI